MDDTEIKMEVLKKEKRYKITRIEKYKNDITKEEKKTKIKFIIAGLCIMGLMSCVYQGLTNEELLNKLYYLILCILNSIVFGINLKDGIEKTISNKLAEHEIKELEDRNKTIDYELELLEEQQRNQAVEYVYAKTRKKD